MMRGILLSIINIEIDFYITGEIFKLLLMPILYNMVMGQ